MDVNVVEQLEIDDDSTNRVTDTFSSETPKKIPLKRTITFVLFYSHFSVGLAVYTLGPALIDLKVIYHAEMQQLSAFFTVASVGFVAGAFSSFLVKWLNRQLMIAGYLLSSGLSHALVPHCQSPYLLYCCGFFFGFGGGGLDVSISVWLIELWQAASAPILQATRFAYGLGAIVGPLFVGRFLSGDIRPNIESTIRNINIELTPGNNYNYNYNNRTSHGDGINRQRLLAVPFSVNGAVGVMGSLLIFVLYFYKKYQPPKHSEMTSSKQKPKFSTALTALIVVLGAVMLTFYFSAELSMFLFLPSFAHFSPVGLEVDTAATLLLTLTTTYILSKLAFIPIAARLAPEKILYATYSIVVLSYGLLLFSANRNDKLLWVSAVLLGLGFAANYPSILAFLEQHLVITNRKSTIFVTSIGLIDTVMPLLIGSRIESMPNLLIFVGFVFFGVSIAAFAVIHVVVWINKTYLARQRIDQ